MSPVTRKLFCRTMINAIWNQAELDRTEVFFAPDAVHHELEEVAGGLACSNSLLRQFVGLYHRGFPDLHLTVLEQTSDDDRVITRWRAEGTQTGRLLTIEPSDRSMSVEGMRTDRFEDGRIVETWSRWDVQSMLEQIGAVPAAERPAATPVLELADLAYAAAG